MGEAELDRSAWRPPPPRLALTRALLLRALGLVYALSFTIGLHQNPALIGARGLTPAEDFVARYVGLRGGPFAAFVERPSLFMLTGASDLALQGAAALGLALSLAVCAGWGWGPVMLTLWALSLSLAQVGQVWTGYGWELLLLEAGALAVFLAPWRAPGDLTTRSRPPRLVIWLFRWLLFRLMLGAGLIKLRGDPCWLALECLDFHFETQPMPHPWSRAWHELPGALRAAGVGVNHVAELLLPPLLLLGRPWRAAAGLGVIVFQVSLIASGNLAFLNWLTLALALAAFDDEQLLRWVPRRWRPRLEARSREASAAPRGRLATAALASWGVVVAVGSVGPVVNLASSEQVMNGSFDRLRLVNSYGAFGTVGRERLTAVVQVRAGGGDWEDWPWACQPVDVARRPCWLTPYHLRLDWQAWFVPLDDARASPWLVHLVARLLARDPLLMDLMGPPPPAAARADEARVLLYRYAFAPSGQGRWWRREARGEILRPFRLDDPELVAFLQAYGWPVPRAP